MGKDRNVKKLRKLFRELVKEGYEPDLKGASKVGRRAIRVVLSLPAVYIRNPPKERNQFKNEQRKSSYYRGAPWRRPYGTAGRVFNSMQLLRRYLGKLARQGGEQAGEDGVAQNHGLGEASGDLQQLPEEGQPSVSSGSDSDNQEQRG